MKIELPQSIELKKHSGFWKQIGMIIIGTTISLVLTIGASMTLGSSVCPSTNWNCCPKRH